MAVFPSADILTEMPCRAEPVLPVPTNLLPSWASGGMLAIRVKLLPLVTLPPAVVIPIVPVVAPGITIATKLVPVFEMAMALTPPIVKAEGVLKLVPVIVTKVPTVPLEGVNELMVGACEKTFVAKNIATKRITPFNKIISLFFIINFINIKTKVIYIFLSIIFLGQTT
jgi:hypothetical protein